MASEAEIRAVARIIASGRDMCFFDTTFPCAGTGDKERDMLTCFCWKAATKIVEIIDRMRQEPPEPKPDPPVG
jgi:hypothetical protein